MTPLKNVDTSPLIRDPFQRVFEDLGITPTNTTNAPPDYNVLGKLRDNQNYYQQVWTAWLSRAALHVAKVSDDGEFLVIGGGYLLDTELHIYRWNQEERQYVKVWEAGSGILTRDVYDVDFGDSDNNNLIEIAAACADGRVYLFEQAHISDPIANLENRFDLVWKSPERYFQVSAVEFYDSDLDGTEDLIIGSWDNKIHIFEYTKHSNYPFSTEHWITLTEKWNSSELDDKIQSLGVGDFNGNGLPDIVVGTLSGSVYVFENDGVVLAPYGIEFPFPNDDNYRPIWNNSGIYQPIWHTIGQIAVGELDDIVGSEAVLLSWGQGVWVLRYSKERDFYLEQLIQNFEGWQMQGAYPLDNFADWMVKGESMNSQLYYQHGNGTKYPEPWNFAAQNAFDIFANSAVTGEPAHSTHGGVLFNGNEYRLFTTTQSWISAKASCEALGGHLVTISDQEENEFVANLTKNVNYFWIGLTDASVEGTWQWVTGEPVTYTNWLAPNPNNWANQDRAIMYGGTYGPYYSYPNAHGGWNDLANTGPYYYVCEWEGGRGGALFNGHEYKLFTTTKNWANAKADCEALGGHLATITSKEENEFVTNLVGNLNVRIGLTDNEAYGGQEDTDKTGSSPYWVWITSETVTYTNWYGGAPTPSGDEDYVELVGNWGGLWNDIRDDHLRAYVCEWDSLTAKGTTFYTNNTGFVTYHTDVSAPHGGAKFNYHEYEYIPNLVNWTTAKAECESLGGHLVTITSSEENEFVTSLIGDNRVLIGLTDSPTYATGASEGDFRWITNEDVSYTNWTVGAPTGGTSKNYTELIGDYDGPWNDISDSAERYYVCEWDGVLNGSYFDGHEYKLIQDLVNFDTAKDECENMGGYLATITSDEENEFITRLVGDYRALIGLTDSPVYGATEDSFQWITGEPLNYTKWSGKEPGGGMSQNFVEIMGDWDGIWNDIANDDLRYYVCEIDYNTTIITPFESATGTWNLGKGEELASNGNNNPDLYIIFDPTMTPDPTEWNISLSNNLINWYQINSTDISPSTQNNGLAIDVDPLFSAKKMMSAQYIRLTLLQGNSTDFKERKVNAIVFPYVARPLTIAASVTIEPLSFTYNEQNSKNKIVFGGSDGRLLAFQYEPHNISYYKKFTNKPAELTEIPGTDYGIVNPSFTQIWDSFTNDFWNLGETIWSIQGTPKQTYIPSWRYKTGETKEFNAGTSPGLTDLHHLSVSDMSKFFNPNSGEFVVTRTDDSTIRAYNIETGAEIPKTGGGVDIFWFVNAYLSSNNTVATTAFGDLYQGGSEADELIIFPWYKGPFKKPTTYDESLLPKIYYLQDAAPTWEYYATDPYYAVLSDLDGQMFNFLADSTTYPSATIVDVDNDTLQDIIISNGRLALLWNIGTNTSPSFKFDFDYFKELNERAPSNPIFSPNAWDYDQDGDYDITYSYGRGSGDLRYGMDFFENLGTSTNPQWVRNAYVMKNPTTDGSLRFNNYTAGVVIPSNSNEKSAESLWVWNGVTTPQHLRNLIAEVDQQTAFIIGTNPELLKLEVNLRQSPPDAVNFGYSILKSWTNTEELEDWTLTLTTSLNLDGDNNSEIIVSDYDNNLIVFEHLTENTYKRAWKSQDLNHTEETTFSPYKFQDLEGVSGDFKKTIFDHGNLLVSGFDYDEDGNEEFILTAALSLYVFEATGFNDEFKLIFEKDHQEFFNDSSITQFSAITLTPDFDGRGPMIAFAAQNVLFLLRFDPQLGWLESFQPISGLGFYDVPGNPFDHPELDIRALLFADLNQNGNTELWIGGQNSSGNVDTGFLLALDSNYGDIQKIYDFPTINSTVINDLETADANYDGKLELIIAHGHGLDIWEADKDPNDFKFTLMSYVSSDPIYGQEKVITPVFNTYQSPNGLAPRSHELLQLQGGNNYFSIYGVEEDNHDPYNHEDIGVSLQNTTYGNGRLFYSITPNPTSLGTIKDPNYQVSRERGEVKDHGGVLYNGHEYKLINSFKNWADAKADCEAQGGHLVTFSTIEENTFVQNAFGSFPSFAWIGLTDEVTEDTWLWVTGESDTLANWIIAPTTDDYAGIRSSDGQWADLDGTQVHRYICEWDDLSYEPRDDSILITEVYYENDLDPGNTSYQWIELYNPNWFDVRLNGWNLTTSTQSVFLWGNISAHDYFLIASNLSVFTSEYPSAPTPFIPVTALQLGTVDELQLVNSLSDVEDSLSWGNGIYWPLEANGTSLVRNQTTGYMESIYPLKDGLFSDWINSSITVLPGQGNYTSAPLGYEVRPAITQSETGTITVAWIAGYVSPNDIYGRTVNIQQFDSTGTPLTPYYEVDSLRNKNGFTSDPNYFVVYKDVAILELEDLLVVGYVLDDILKTPPSYTGFSGNLSLKLINTTDWTITDKSAPIGIDTNYTLSSIDLLEIKGQIGVVFSGYSRNSLGIINEEIYFTLLNSTYHNQGFSKILSGTGNYQFVSATNMPKDPNNIFVTCEHVTGSMSEVVSVFSSDNGNSWSQEYALFSDDPNLEVYNAYESLRTKGAKASVSNRQIFKPRVTMDNTGGIYYQFVTRFLIENDSDPNYSGNLVDFYGNSSHLVTQQWIGQLKQGGWFEYTDIFNVRDIAVGDTDNDLRSELFISHDSRVTLLEINQKPDGTYSYLQKWQYQPPLFISLHPEQVNSTFAKYITPAEAKPRETGAVSILDTNGNGWPELIFSVRGGDIFSFEIVDNEQPINDLYAITEEILYSNASYSLYNTSLLITEVLCDHSDSADVKWVEIYNPTNSPVSLDGWRLSDFYTSENNFYLSGTVNAGGYFLVAQKISSFQTSYPGAPTPNLEWISGNNLSMIPAGNTLKLIDSNSVIIDSVSWGLDTQNQLLIATNESLRRLALIDTDLHLDWENTGSVGTPGTDPYYNQPSNTMDSLLVDVNKDGELDLIIADGKYGNGLVAWNLQHDSLLWRYPVAGSIGKIYFLNNSLDEIIIGITSKGVFGVSLNGTQRYWIVGASLDPGNNHAFSDINNDAISDLIVATTTKIFAIKPISGEVIWNNVKPDLNAIGYFDLAVGNIGNTSRISVCSSDFSTYKMVNILRSNGSIVKSFNLTHLTKFDIRSQSILGDFDGDLQLDFAIAIFDNYADSSHLEVYNLNTLNLLLNQTIPTVGSIDLSCFDIYSKDTNNDFLADIILPIPNFETSTALFPSNGHSSGIFAVDVTSASLIWQRYFNDSMVKFEIASYDEREVILTYTSNSGLFVVSTSGADVLWAVQEYSGQSVVANIAKDSSTNQTIIVVSYPNGNGPVSKVVGMLTEATNTITPQTYAVNTKTEILYSEQTETSFTIPVVVTNDGAEKLFVAFTNGTLILRSFDHGEIWRSSISNFSTISACGLEIKPGEYGLAFKADTSDLYILEGTSTDIWAQISSSGSNVTALSLDGSSDVLLSQSIANISGTISIFDPISKSYIWSHTNAAYYSSLSVVSLDVSNLGIDTHIVALDWNGTAKLIELPSTHITGGNFPTPSVGTKWISIRVIENRDQLTEVYLLSDGGQLARYSWLSSGEITTGSSFIGDPHEIVSWDVADQGSYNDILLVTRNNGSRIIRDNGSTMTVVKEFTNYYIDSYDHHFANIDNNDTNELVMVVGNSLVILTSEGDIVESHSYPENIIRIRRWFVDSTRKPAFIGILSKGIIAVVDPSGRIIGTQYGEAAVADFRYNSPMNQQQDESESSMNKAPRTHVVYPFIQIFLVSLVMLSLIFITKRKRQFYSNIRRI